MAISNGIQSFFLLSPLHLSAITSNDTDLPIAVIKYWTFYSTYVSKNMGNLEQNNKYEN